MGAFFYRPPAVVFNFAAPEDGLAFVVGALQFEPGVVGIDSAAGEKVSNLFCADYDIDADGIAAAQRRLNAGACEPAASMVPVSAVWYECALSERLVFAFWLMPTRMARSQPVTPKWAPESPR